MFRLILDIGNSASKYAVVNGRNIVRSEKSDLPSLEILARLLQEYPETASGIIAASGREPAEIYDFLSSRLKPVVKFNSATPVPVRNMYKTPETLGVDRLAGAIGANSFFPNENILLFSFGTALTIDFISENKYLGGNISPGLQMRFQALHKFTARLPLCTPPRSLPACGSTTGEAIESGTVTGMIAEVSHYINNYKTYKIIFTGGDAFYFADKIKFPVFVLSNSVIYGLNEVLKYNECSAI